MHIFGLAIYLILLLASSWTAILTGGSEGHSDLNLAAILINVVLTLLGIVLLLNGAAHILEGVGH